MDLNLAAQGELPRSSTLAEPESCHSQDETWDPDFVVVGVWKNILTDNFQFFFISSNGILSVWNQMTQNKKFKNSLYQIYSFFPLSLSERDVSSRAAPALVELLKLMFKVRRLKRSSQQNHIFSFSSTFSFVKLSPKFFQLFLPSKRLKMNSQILMAKLFSGWRKTHNSNHL